MPYNIDETLKSSDLPDDVKPHLIWREVLLGASKKAIFFQAVEETEELIGNTGTKISVPYVSQGFSAQSATEGQVDSGYSVTEMAIADIDLTIGNIIYVATRISDVLKEDQPKYDFVRIALRKIGDALSEDREEAIRDALIAGTGHTINAGSAGTLAYGDIVNAIKTLKNSSWHPTPENPPLLIVNPNQEADLVQSTLFTDTSRYSDAEAPFVGEKGRYASCRVLVSEQMTDALALVVMPPNYELGATTIFAWKRKTLVKSQEETLYGRTLYVVSERYGVAVVQASGIVLISNT